VAIKDITSCKVTLTNNTRNCTAGVLLLHVNSVDAVLIVCVMFCARLYVQCFHVIIWESNEAFFYNLIEQLAANYFRAPVDVWSAAELFGLHPQLQQRQQSSQQRRRHPCHRRRWSTTSKPQQGSGQWRGRAISSK
jgi:hypothetical protein